jgi:hypothetical protein
MVITNPVFVKSASAWFRELQKYHCNRIVCHYFPPDKDVLVLINFLLSKKNDNPGYSVVDKLFWYYCHFYFYFFRSVIVVLLNLVFLIYSASMST